MKKILPLTVMFLCLGFCLAIFFPLTGKSQIFSAPGGGLWNSSSTWVDGIIPTSGSDVVIVSTVSVNTSSAACNNLSISGAGVLQNHTTNSYTLTINGNLTNEGTIANNASYGLNLTVLGNITNNSTWTNSTLTFGGSGNHELASSQQLVIENVNKSLAGGRVRATTPLSFSGTNINLNDTLEFTTGNSITVNGGTLNTFVLYKSALPALQITAVNGAYSFGMTIDAPQIDLNGTMLIYSTNNFKGHVINYGTLQNRPVNSYSLNVNGNFTNNGTIQNDVYSLYLNISGNLVNNGTWTNYSTTLNGSGNQELSMTQPLGCSVLTKNASAGRVKAISNLSFIGTSISLNDTIEFTTGNSIALSGGDISSGVLFKSALPALQITTDNGAYLYILRIDAPQIDLYGTVKIYSTNNFKGQVVNYGTLQNSQQNSYTLNITGNIINNGTIQNNVYNLYLNISGNVTNNGNWTNYSTTLNGSGNQELSMTQPFGCSNLTRNTAAGRLKAISDLSFAGTSITLNDTLEFTTGNSLALNGGNLSTGVLYKSALPVLKITTENGAYLYLITVVAPQAELYGTILIYSTNTFKGHIINNGILQNSPQNSYSLNLTGNLINNGTIKNNVYFFYLNISGNISNNSTWTNYSTILNGQGNQELSMTQPLACSFLTRNAAAGRLRATSDLSFAGTEITLNDTLEFTTGNSLVLSGGYISSGVLYKSALPALEITSGSGAYSYLMTIDAPQIELYGTLQIYSTNNFKGNVINYGTLQNSNFNNYVLSITGNLTNNGTVKNNIYNFNLNISGNITNNGAWKNDLTTLTGTNTHYLAFSNKFEGASFVNNNAAASLISTTDLSFDGTDINLNGCLFTLATGSRFSVINGYLLGTTFSGSDIHFHSLGAYCQGVVFASDVSLHGVFEVGSGVGFNGSIINEGVLRNRRTAGYGILVQGGIQNNGTITNNVHDFSITVLGDIYNNGVWSNLLTTLDKTSDQNIFLVNGNAIQGQIRLDANFTGSTFAWWGPQGNLTGNAGFSGANTQIISFLNPVTDAFAGQYYCLNNLGVHSRNVFIQSQVIPVRILSLNLLLEGLYNSNGIMNPSLEASGAPVWNSDIADQITVELHDNGNFSNIVYTKAEVLLSTNGSISFAVPAAYSGSYYLAVRHRSGIVTVSATPVAFITPQVNYNFNLASQAFGNNMALMSDGWYAFFGGDVNQDGTVDIADMTPVDNGSAAFLNGYRNPDTNADGIIDIADMTIIDNNSSDFVSAVYP